MLGLRTPELLVIGVIVLLLFGPQRLAGLGAGLGQGIRGFKKGLDGGDDAAGRAASGEAPPPQAAPRPGDGPDGPRP
jgi:sec-independent protein translocase protein TatA